MVPARKICCTRAESFPATCTIMSTSSGARKVWRTRGRMLRYSASSSVYFTAMVSGSGTGPTWVTRRGRLRRAALRRDADRRRLRCCEIISGFSCGLFRQALANFVAEQFAVNGFAFEFGARGFYDVAHLFQGVRAGFSDGFLDGTLHFNVAGSGG